MKKILSTVAALGLVAGMATAAQALEFKVSGHYFVEGVYQSSGEGAGVSLVEDTTGEERSNDAFWRQEFIIRPVMQVNDKIVVKSKIYLANGPVDNAGTDGTWGTEDTNGIDGNNINVHHLFMEYMSPIGKVRVGRTSSGLWQGDFLSSDKNNNRLMYFPNFMPENWGSCVFLQKSAEGDSTDPNDSSNGDSDVYEVSAWYKTKDLVVAMGYDFFEDSSNINFNKDRHLLKGYYNQNFGAMYTEMEFQYVVGEQTYSNSALDVDIENFAIMADVGMTMDKLDIGMLAFYATGDSDGATNLENDAALSNSAEANGLGEQFQPYVILTGATTGMLTGDYNAANADMVADGVVSLGMHADFAATDKLSLHTAIGFAQAEDTESIQDKDYGWEIDLGVSYKLMDNLTYAVDFGYLMTGDYFEEGTTTIDTNDVYVLNHRLTMEF